MSSQHRIARGKRESLGYGTLVDYDGSSYILLQKLLYKRRVRLITNDNTQIQCYWICWLGIDWILKPFVVEANDEFHLSIKSSNAFWLVLFGVHICCICQVD